MPSNSKWCAIGCGLLIVWAGCSSDTTDGSRSGGGAATGSKPGGSGGSRGGDGFGNNQGTKPPTGTSGSGSTAGSGGDDSCAKAQLDSTRKMPTILFVIDGSGSMCAPFGGSTRWQSLRTALLDPTNGLVYRLQQSVSFGMLLYDGTIDIFAIAGGIGGMGMGMGGMSNGCEAMYFDKKAEGDCPGLVEVAPAVNNAMAIDMMYPATELGGSTPTDKAMNRAVDQMIAMVSTNPDVVNNPLYIILATDGQPNDICMGSAGGDGSVQRQGVIDAAKRAAESNITTFVISTAGGDAALEAHLNDVAKAGNPADPMAHTYAPTNPEELVTTLATLLGGAIGCSVTLNGEVTPGQECRGSVKLNGAPLACCKQEGATTLCNDAPTDPADGWRLHDPRTIELTGTTCTNFLAAPSVSLSADFPCDAFMPD